MTHYGTSTSSSGVLGTTVMLYRHRIYLKINITLSVIKWNRAKYKDSEISSFVTGLELNIEAVKNGVTQDMNSGFVEGCNCKYKLILRIMYGRASTELLMKKFYMASNICRCDISINEILQLKVPGKYYSSKPLSASC